MVTTITPAVFAGRRDNWWIATIAFIVGGIIGGSMTGLLLASTGAGIRRIVPLEGDGAWAIVLVSTIGYATHAFGWVRLPTLRIRRQVPRGLRSRVPLTLAGFVYGIDLGMGFLTQIVTTSLYVLWLAVIALGDLWSGVLTLGVFGLTRNVTTAAFGAGLPTLEAATRRVDAMIPLQPMVRGIDVLALSVIGVVCCFHLIRIVL